jgi:hypothetical protein
MKPRMSLLLQFAIVVVATGQLHADPKLAPIVFVSSGKLCSSSGTDDAHTACLDRREEFSSPSWRPDGSGLVVEVGKHDGPHSLVLLDRRGRTTATLDGSAEHIRPVWAPDGRHVFAIDYELGRAIARWDANGKSRTEIPVTGYADSAGFQMIALSPSGRRAALLGMDFRQLVIVKVSDTQWVTERVAPSGFSFVSQSAWVDDERLIFVGEKDGSRGELWELNVADGSVRRIGIDGLWLRDQMALSPGGDSVIVTATAVGAPLRWTLWRFEIATRMKSQLTTGIEDVDPTWRR